MAKIEESGIYKALTADTKDNEAILSALGSAAVDFCCRSSTGQTYVHLAAANLRSTDLPEAWNILLARCDMFVRDVNGSSGLDCMIENLPVSWSNQYLKNHLLGLGSDVDRIDECTKRACLSGKTLHLRRLAGAAKADNRLGEKLTQIVKIEEELIDLHKALRCKTGSDELVKSLTEKERVVVPDFVGLPALHIATVHGQQAMLTALVEKFPECINAQDNMGRTALHYAASMKGEEAEAIVKLLTDAKADATVKDINDCDVEAYKTSANMEEYMSNYATNLDRQSGCDMMYRVHEAVLSGDLRAVKMALDRRELAVKQDASKLTPLHKAVILKCTAIATWLAEQFKSSMDVQGNSGLTPMHFAAVVDKELYETLKAAGGDCHTVDVEGNDPEYYKDHSSDFILDVDALREELLITPPSRPATAASERAKSAGKPDTAGAEKPASAAPTRVLPTVMAAKKAPPPETLDAKYIADVLGSPLTAALAEVAEKRPWDPIEYLAQWLYKHKANLDYHQQQIDAVKEAEREEQRKKEEAENRARRRREAIYLKEQEEEMRKRAEEEARKQKEQEELQKKAKESIHLSQAPELPTVTEDEETVEAAPISPRNVAEKDEQGRTVLHNLVVSAASVEDVTALLTTSGIDLLAERDVEGKTARDLAESDEQRECLDGFVINALKAGENATIIKLMENGYSISDLNINPEEHELPEVATQLLAKVTNFPKLLAAICKHIRLGNMAAVKQTLDKPSLAVTRLNACGATALHLAVLYEQVDIVQHLVTSYPGIVDCRDYINRTALHYAYGIGNEEQRDSIIKVLIEGKADAEAVDCRGRKPEDYQELAEEFIAMKAPEPVDEETEAEEAAPAEGEQAPADGEQPPVEGEQPPVEGEQPPVEGEQPPVEGEQPPVEGEQPPVEGEQPPVEGEQSPAGGEVAPDGDEAPAE